MHTYILFVLNGPSDRLPLDGPMATGNYAFLIRCIRFSTFSCVITNRMP